MASVATAKPALVVRLARRPSGPVIAAGGLVLASVVVGAAWQALDTAAQAAFPARYLIQATQAFQSISAGHWAAPFRTVYAPDNPPLLHYLGALTMRLVGHPGVDGPVIALDLVFLPILAWAVFAVTQTLAGGWFAAAAVALALGAPITVSASHLFAPALGVMALTAASVALLMASRRFVLPGRAFAAGVVMALGLLCSPSLAVYVLPFTLALVATGGWRHPRGIAAAAAGLLVLALPWYVMHRHGQVYILRQVVHQGGALGAGDGVFDRIGRQAWSFVSTQYLLGMCVLGLVGVVTCVAGCARRGPRVPYGLELLVGLAGGLVLTGLALPGDRPYSAPLLIFVVALAVCWAPRLSGRTALAAAAVIGLLGLVNATLVNVGAGRLGVTVGGNPAHRVTLLSGAGYLASAPRRDGDLVSVLNDAFGAGFQTTAVTSRVARYPELSATSVDFASTMAGLRLVTPATLGPRGVLIVRMAAPVAAIPPCARYADGSALYLRPRGSGPLSCPGPDRP